jgi:hypothetical protein
MGAKIFAQSVLGAITFAGISVLTATNANAIILGSNIKTDTKFLFEADVFLNNAYDAGSTLLINGINWSFRATEVFAVPAFPKDSQALQALQLSEITHLKPPHAGEGVNVLNSTIIFPRFTAINGGGQFSHPPNGDSDMGSGKYFQLTAVQQAAAGVPVGAAWKLEAKLQHVPEPTTIPGIVLTLGFLGAMFKKGYLRPLKKAVVKA